MANSENTITSMFVNVLRNMRDAWTVNEQITRPFLNAAQKPDVIVTEAGRNPVDTLGPIGKPNSLLQIEATMKFGHARMTILVQRSHSTNPGTPKVTSEILFTGHLFL